MVNKKLGVCTEQEVGFLKIAIFLEYITSIYLCTIRKKGYFVYFLQGKSS